MSTEAATPTAGRVDPVGSDLAKILRALKLSGLKDTLPERLVTARTNKLGHAAFLELLLSDELNRSESRSAALRAARAGAGSRDAAGDLGRRRGPDLRPDAFLRPEQPGIRRSRALRPAPGTCSYQRFVSKIVVFAQVRLLLGLMGRWSLSVV